MKKLLFALFMLLGGSAYAIDFQVSREEAGFVKYKWDDIAASTTAILVDLSDITNFPHSKTGYVVVNALRVNIDKAAASTGTVRIGLIVAISTTVGSVEWIHTTNFDRDTVSTHLEEMINFAPACIRAYANTSGATPYLIGISTANSTLFQSDVNLPTTYQPSGAVAPAVGDLVLRYDAIGSTAMDIEVELWYDTRR
jgi:hypothetical protein